MKSSVISDAYTSKDLVYQWQNEASVNFVPGMTLSQFDLMSFPYRNFTFTRREGTIEIIALTTLFLSFFRWFLRSSSLIQSPTTHRLLPYSSLCTLHTYSGTFLGILLDPSGGHIWPCGTWNYHRFDIIHHQFGLQNRSTQSTICNSFGLVSFDELLLLYCHPVGIRRRTLLHKGITSAKFK